MAMNYLVFDSDNLLAQSILKWLNITFGEDFLAEKIQVKGQALLYVIFCILPLARLIT